MKQKILFVINTLGHAGAETAMIELMKSLDDKRFDISLYVLLGQGELIHRIPKHVKVLNKSFSDASVLSKEGSKNMRNVVLKAATYHANLLRLLPYMCIGLLEMLKKHRLQLEKLLWRLIAAGSKPNPEVYDTAIAFIEGGSAYYVAERVNATRKIGFIHIDYEKAGYSRKLDQDCYLRFDRILTVSEEVKEHFLEVYPECSSSIDIFHNILNINMILKKSKDNGGFTDDFDGTRILTVGRLTHQKAFDIAIDAMTILINRGLKVRWYVVGEGPERNRLERKLERAGLTKDFILLGATNNPFPYYRQTDLYLHTTRFEGKSIAIQEAQILGCAIIASDCSGNREQLEHEKDGLLCELLPESIADSIERLMKDSGLREKFTAASKVKSLYATEELEQFKKYLLNK